METKFPRVGWNALLYQKWTDREIQKIVYLPQINESPTSHSVVAETMRRSQKVSQECQRVNSCYLRFGNCKNGISNSK